MTKQIGRREFLRKSVLGVGSVVLASSIQAINSTTSFFSAQNNLPTSVADPNLMALYKQAKEYFYQKQYSSATSLFTQLIENNPNVLFLYDGLAKVYGAQQNMSAVAGLFKQGVQNNPNNAFFLHRYGMSLRNMCLGNAVQAQNFASQNNISNLYEYAAERIITANSLNPKECFQLDLKDFPRLMEKYNDNPRSSSTLVLSDDIISQINTTTVSASTKWTNTRTSRKPNVPPEENDLIIIGNTTIGNRTNRNIIAGNRNNSGNTGNKGKGKGKHKRTLHSNKEQQEREKSEKKAKKYVNYNYLLNNANQKNTQKVEKWGMQILADDITDTNTVGFMRKYYKKGKHSDRIIAVNRYFYNNSNSVYSALALAASLVKYSNGTSSLNEAKEVLSSVAQYLDNLTSIGKGAYYITSAKIKIKENNIAQAQSLLLEGIETQNGVGGVAYSLMEHYATTFPNNQKIKAINIQKALCGKPYSAVADQLAPYLEKYSEFISQNPRKVTEQIKALNALAKLQKNYNSSDYNETINEINALKAKNKE